MTDDSRALALRPGSLVTLEAASAPAPRGSSRAKFTRLAAHMASFEVIATLTLVLLMHGSGEPWYSSVPVTALAISALLYRPLLRRANFWLAVTALLASGNFYGWFEIDNHKYLITYWCLSIYVARESHDPARVLSESARYLIGLCFSFATFWKAISPDYLSGDFFYYELLSDGRFANMAAYFAGSPPGLLLHNAQATHALTAYDSTLTSVSLHDVPGLRELARSITFWTIGIEALLALLFLLPENRSTFALRSGALLTFLLTTYSNAPVLGFGWVLAVMGAAQCRPRAPWVSALFVATFLALWLYGIPWSALTYSAFGLRIPFAR